MAAAGGARRVRRRAVLLLVTTRGDAPGANGAGRRATRSSRPAFACRLIAHRRIRSRLLRADQRLQAGSPPSLVSSMARSRRAAAPTDDRRSGAGLDDHRDGPARGGPRRSRRIETRRVAGIRASVITPSVTHRAVRSRAATDLLRLTRPSIASGHERREKTFWEVADGRGPAHRRRELVGDLAGAAAPRRRPHRSRRAAAGTRRGARRGDRAGGGLPAAAGAVAGDPRAARARAADAFRAEAADPTVVAVLRRSAELDAMTLALAWRASTRPVGSAGRLSAGARHRAARAARRRKAARGFALGASRRGSTRLRLLCLPRRAACAASSV